MGVDGGWCERCGGGGEMSGRRGCRLLEGRSMQTGCLGRQEGAVQGGSVQRASDRKRAAGTGVPITTKKHDSMPASECPGGEGAVSWEGGR